MKFYDSQGNEHDRLISAKISNVKMKLLKLKTKIPTENKENAVPPVVDISDDEKSVEDNKITNIRVDHEHQTLLCYNSNNECVASYDFDTPGSVSLESILNQ